MTIEPEKQPRSSNWTPYQEEIANTRGEYTRALLMAKAEGYRIGLGDAVALRESHKRLMEALKAVVPPNAILVSGSTVELRVTALALSKAYAALTAAGAIEKGEAT